MAAEDVLVTTQWVADHAQRRQAQARRGRRRHQRLRRGPHRRRARLELDLPAAGPGAARHHHAERAREAAQRVRHQQRRHGHPLRRQQQLVRRLRLLGAARCTATRTSSSWTAAARSGWTKTARPPPTLPSITHVDLQGERRRTRSCAPSATRSSRRLGKTGKALVDVRSPAEFSGEILAPPGLQETAQRGGHIPGAANVPVGAGGEGRRHLQVGRRPQGALRRARASRRTRKSSLTAASASARRTPGSCSSTCSATTNVRNYDGSWTEYGSMIDVPVEKP